MKSIFTTIRVNGPTRVLVNGKGLTPIQAAYLGVHADWAFVRKDGWSLGCTSENMGEAHDLWAGSWAGRLHLATGLWEPAT